MLGPIGPEPRAAGSVLERSHQGTKQQQASRERTGRGGLHGARVPWGLGATGGLWGPLRGRWENIGELGAEE